jgi:hypothetical protein
MFAPAAQKYRSGSRMAIAILGIGFALVFTGFLLPKAYTGWIVAAFFVCWLVLVVIAITRSELECPACHGNLVSSQLGSYCPGGWFRSPHCDSCGKSLRRGKSRQYRIRACTHCGLVLDERGL